VPELSWYSPTAVQVSVAVQDTLFSGLSSAPDGLGVVWTVQVVPFHPSAKGPVGSALLSEYWPAAVQALAEVQDTPENTFELMSVGLGVVWVAQDVPFHRSAKVTTSPELSCW
jgi:hypothetical protein